MIKLIIFWSDPYVFTETGNYTYKMKKYLDKQGNSGVCAYEIKPHGIRVQFNNREADSHFYSIAMISNVQLMKFI